MTSSVTGWERFKALTPDNFIEHKVQPVLIDVRRIFDPQQFRDRLEFSPVGLGTARPLTNVTRTVTSKTARRTAQALKGQIATFMSLAGTEQDTKEHVRASNDLREIWSRIHKKKRGANDGNHRHTSCAHLDKATPRDTCRILAKSQKRVLTFVVARDKLLIGLLNIYLTEANGG